ncbi:MAG: endopeptidase La [Bacteriovoracaceae bacterium]|jgi:ATP-dependent Lon protease|nr:endopeptidase La [Halobacteriovoraceae bacterium]MDP7321376.1 endopeptidase La [Bacteriovoracaceae bacterium]
MVTNYEGENIEFKETLPLLPIRDLVVYPFMILPLYVGRESSIQAVEEAINTTDRLILLASQKDIHAEAPSPSEIYNLGTVAMIMRKRNLPDGRLKILVQGLTKARILQFEQNDPFFKVKLTKTETVEVTETQEVIEALLRNVRENLELVINKSKVLSPDILMILEDIHNPSRFADLVASNLNLKVEQAQEILETLNPVDRLNKINDILHSEIKILSYQEQIKSSTNEEISKTQKEYFLREQIKQMKSELGDNTPQDEFSEIRQKISHKNMPSEIESECLKQLTRLERMHPDSSESSILRGYLEWMSDLPWSETSEEITDLNHAMEVLNRDHFDLKKIKERILEHLAVRTLKGGKVKGPILCFSGPPGVGKTSLGKSIARSMGREFVRISLGGVKDESEIRGHRRTYVGAMPGRFIQAMKQAKTTNPVIMLDEIDKLGSDYKGDPSSALLEVLDPEQNAHFRDHYLNVNYDLSNVMFVATANVLENIPGPLRDRMEIINLSGYTQEEKLEISKQYLIPKQMDENGITHEHIDFHDDGVKTVIDGFTREAGLRNLERQIGSLCRKVAKKIAVGESTKTHILPDAVEELLGPALYSKEDHKEFDEVGVATGLAWTAAGGEILFIEATKMKGSGITLTGQLGDVMKESAQAAIGFIRSQATKLGIDENIFDKHEIHIHLPAGAIPKDGPSAGITLATSVVSLLTETLISKDIAMTGEITLTGKVLPVGGIKEKALAAMRVGIETIIIPWKNQKDLTDIPEEFRKKINFIPVKNFQEVLEVAILDWEPHAKKIKKSSKTHPTKEKSSSIAA